MVVPAAVPRASRDGQPRISRAAALAGVLLMAGGLVAAVVGQQQLTGQLQPSQQYIDGRYWTIDPGTCLGMGIETRAACMAKDTATAVGLERERQNLVTVRALGWLLLGTGTAVLVLAFVRSRRAAERLLA